MDTIEATAAPAQAPKRDKAPIADRLNGWAFVALLATIFLLPIFLIPSALFSLALSKLLLLAAGTSVSLALHFAGAFKKGTLALRKSFALGGFAVFALAFLLAAAFSPQIGQSLWGYGFEIGTVSFVATMFLLMASASVLVDSKDRLMRVFQAVAVSFAVLLAIHVARLLLGPAALTLGLFGDASGTPIGKWYELGIFAFVMAVMSVNALEGKRVPTAKKVLAWAGIVATIFLLTLVAFPIATWAVLAFAVVFSIIKFVTRKPVAIAAEGEAPVKKAPWQDRFRVSVAALVLLVVSLAFVIGDMNADTRTTPTLSQRFSSFYKVSAIEARPSAQSTLSVAKDVFKDRPAFGAGPNRFLNYYLAGKPQEIVLSAFWNADFSYGVGWFPSVIAMSGIAGIVGVLAYLAGLVILCIKALRVALRDIAGKRHLLSLVLITVGLTAFAFVYVPSIVGLSFLAFFIGVLSAQSDAPFALPLSNKKGKIAFWVLAVLLAAVAFCVTVGYATAFLATSYYQKTAVAAQKGDVALAETYAARALSFRDQDIYERLNAEVGIAKITALAKAGTEANATAINDAFTAAEKHALRATELDAYNYQNWLQLGKLYEFMGLSFNIPEAVVTAGKAYGEAIKTNPRNPGLYVVLARLAVSAGRLDEAKQALAKALEIKGNYTEAIVFLAQIETELKNYDNALNAAIAAYQTSPTDLSIAVQVGAIKYMKKDYQGAIDVLEAVIGQEPNYANARFYLGLSYAKLLRAHDAIEQFRVIDQLNPGLEQIQSILSNLNAGKAPIPGQ
jgi:tetratricopeptide (TPR) repeat protein